MKAIVSRVSLRRQPSKSPCEGAQVFEYDVSGYKSPPETRHFIEWWIEINTLEELLELNEREGSHGLLVDFLYPPDFETKNRPFEPDIDVTIVDAHLD